MAGPEEASLRLKLRKTLSYHVGRGLRGLRRARLALQGPPRLQRPVFVVGCSRGGTTLVYKLLSASRELGSLARETHEDWQRLNPLAARGWRSHVLGPQDARPGHAEQMARLFYVHTGRRRIVDKNNQNGLAVGYLDALFPDATFVFVHRNPGDNLLSLMRGWQRPERFGAWSAELPAQVRIEGGRYRRWCFFLPEGWRDHLEDPLAEVCAFQYRAVNQALLAAGRSIGPPRWVALAYEDLLERPESTLERLYGACGLSWDDAIRARLLATLEEPYNAFGSIGRDKWRAAPEAAAIAGVLPGLAGVGAELGYPPEAGSPAQARPSSSA